MAMSIVMMQMRLEVLKLADQKDRFVGSTAKALDTVTVADMFYKFIIGE